MSTLAKPVRTLLLSSALFGAAGISLANEPEKPKSAGPPVLEIRVDQPGHPINKTQYGVFFEELQHSGEGGQIGRAHV